MFVHTMYIDFKYDQFYTPKSKSWDFKLQINGLVTSTSNLAHTWH